VSSQSDEELVQNPGQWRSESIRVVLAAAQAGGIPALCSIPERSGQGGRADERDILACLEEFILLPIKEFPRVGIDHRQESMHQRISFSAESSHGARQCDSLDEANSEARSYDYVSSVMLQHALQHLPPEQRVAVKLFYIHGFTYDEIAVLMRCPLKAVRSYIQNGRRNLRLL